MCESWSLLSQITNEVFIDHRFLSILVRFSHIFQDASDLAEIRRFPHEAQGSQYVEVALWPQLKSFLKVFRPSSPSLITNIFHIFAVRRVRRFHLLTCFPCFRMQRDELDGPLL